MVKGQLYPGEISQIKTDQLEIEKFLILLEKWGTFMVKGQLYPGEISIKQT